MKQEILTFLAVDSLLFDELSGVCSTLDKTDLTDCELVIRQYKIIENIWSVPENIRDEVHMIQIYERFIEWGCKFTAKLIEFNNFINYADNLLDFMTIMYDYLPLSSRIINDSLFDQHTLILLYRKFEINSHLAPKLYIQIFTKLWLFCPKQIANENLFCTMMVVLCDLIRNSKFNNFIEELFEYACVVLRMYVDNLGHKISSILVSNKCITLVQVIVRSEKHAIARLHFWWQFMCSVKKEIMRRMIDICLIPFLTNLFGKYITLDKEKRFDYTASPFNCYTHNAELGPFCDFVMSHLLQSIIGNLPPGLPRVNIRLSQLDNDIFSDKHIIEPYIEHFLIAFCHWCHFSALKSKKLPFRLLNIVIAGFANRFSSLSVPESTDIKVEPETPHTALYLIIDKCIILKNMLETELDHLHRPPQTIFSEHSIVISSLVQALSATDESSLTNTVSPPSSVALTNGHTQHGRSLLRSLLHDNLSLMQRLMQISSTITLSDDCSGAWFINCMKLIVATGSSMSIIEDVDQINAHWFKSLPRDGVRLGRGNCAVWINNVRLWCFLALRMFNEFSNDSFTFNHVKDYQELTPIVDYLRAPLLFLQGIDHESLDPEDYTYLCDLHENLYHSYAIKATLIPCLNSNEWCSQFGPLIADQILDHKHNSSGQQALTINFAIRFLRLVVSYFDAIETTNDSDSNYKKNPLWKYVSALSAVYPILDSCNSRLSLQSAPSHHRIFANAESMPTARKLAALSRSTKYVADCDKNFSLGLLLSATAELLCLLKHNPALICNAIGKFETAMAQVIDIGLRKKMVTVSSKARQKSAPTHHDKDAMEIEYCIIDILKRSVCADRNILLDLKHLFVVIFSLKNGLMTPKFMSFIVEYWNTTIMRMAEKQPNKFPKELIEPLKETKKFYPNLRLPKHIQQNVVESEECVDYNITDITDEPIKKLNFGSLIDKLKKQTPTKKTAKEINPPTVYKLQKRQSFSIKRQSSDADYTVIQSPVCKRRRLTEHQKEVLNDQRNQFIPIMYNSLDDILVPRQISQDSDAIISEVTSIDIEHCSSLNDDNDRSSSTKATDLNTDESLMECSKMFNTESSMDIGEFLTQSEVNFQKLIESDKSNFEKNYTEDISDTLTFDEKKTQPNTEISDDNNIQFDAVMSDTIMVDEMNDRSQLLLADERNVQPDTAMVEEMNAQPDERDSQSDTIMSNKEFDEKNTDIETNSLIDTTIKMNDDSKVIDENKIFDEYKRKPLLESNRSIRSPSVTGRTHRMVQMALQNQQKRKDDSPKPTILSVKSESRRPSSIMRHTWSECKKDAKVSFSEPLVQLQCDDICATTEEDDTTDHSEGVYLSPVFNRSQSTTRLSPPTTYDDVTNDVLQSMIDAELPVTVYSPRMFSVTCSNSRMAVKVRQSLDVLEQLSPIKAVDGPSEVMTCFDVASVDGPTEEVTCTDGASVDGPSEVMTCSDVASVDGPTEEVTCADGTLDEALSIVRDALDHRSRDKVRSMLAFLFGDR